jgi:TnpA family transposase
MRDKRLKILSKSEINELYGTPRFTENERKNYFSLNEKEFKIMSARGSLTSKVHFILQLGYFKATSQFINTDIDEIKSDVDFILHEYFDNEKLFHYQISKRTRLSNQALIAEILKFKTDKSVIHKKLKNLLETKTRLSNNPVYLFHEVICYSAQNKLMLLGYSTIQELIGNSIVCEERRIGDLLETNLSHDNWKLIEITISKDENEYVLTALKKDPKSFKQKQIKEEIKKLNDHETLYKMAINVLPKLNITNQNISYYASLAEHYPISNLKKLSPTKQAIYVLCYAYHRHQKINDNLTVSFIHYLEKFKAEAMVNARDKILDDKLEINDDTKSAALVFRFFDDKNISDKELFGTIRKRARKYVKKGKFNVVADYLLGLLFDFQEIKWDKISQLKKKITANLRPIFKVLKLSGDSNQQHLLSAITFLKNYFQCSSNDRKMLIENASIKCIPSNWKNHLMKDGVVDMAKYEFMIYQLIAEQIETGHVYLENSISFKSLLSHLVSNYKWKNKLTLLKQLGNKKLLTPVNKLLDDLEKTLEKLITDVNKRIENGDNKEIKIKKEGDEITFTLPYPGTADKENHPIFKQLPQIGIANVLQFAQKDCNFMSTFTHIKPYDAKDILDPTAIMASIIANATNLGIYKMAQSSDLAYHRMYTQMKNFMRLETLRDANDVITNAIADLPIFKYWNIHDDYIHGSVDGQKFETRLNSFIARYSSKYFGVNRGVVAYTLCANHIPVNSKIISANQHESHFLFDILYNITSAIDINWLSGDGHSINQVNFAILDFIDKQFAPHFKRINHKAETLCGFNPLKQYKDLLIKPQHQANKKIIKKEWDNIQRIIASLLLGETSQHLIVSKLSSHKRKNKTKEALWEYDKILMSIYMLKFINDLVIRKNVRRSLNRGEAYHKLRRAIANVHGQKFRGKNSQEIEMWNECARLMANCMIYYNAELLNALLEKLQKEGNDKLIEALKYISPVAWININLYGFYTFEEEQPTQIDIAKLAKSINMMKTV